LILENLINLGGDLKNINLREKVMRGSLHAGLAFSNTKTAIAHAMSYYFTINKNVPHGIACSFTLPDIIDAIAGENEEIDYALKQIFTETSSTPLRIFLEKLEIKTSFFDYELKQNEINKFKNSLEGNQRTQNSLVNYEKLFEKL
jgi:alcohol dehydrogenase class IV